MEYSFRAYERRRARGTGVGAVRPNGSRRSTKEHGARQSSRSGVSPTSDPTRCRRSGREPFSRTSEGQREGRTLPLRRNQTNQNFYKFQKGTIDRSTRVEWELLVAPLSSTADNGCLVLHRGLRLPSTRTSVVVTPIFMNRRVAGSSSVLGQGGVCEGTKEMKDLGVR